MQQEQYQASSTLETVLPVVAQEGFTHTARPGSACHEQSEVRLLTETAPCGACHSSRPSHLSAAQEVFSSNRHTSSTLQCTGSQAQPLDQVRIHAAAFCSCWQPSTSDAASSGLA